MPRITKQPFLFDDVSDDVINQPLSGKARDTSSVLATTTYSMLACLAHVIIIVEPNSFSKIDDIIGEALFSG